MPKLPINYQKSLIYKLCCNNTDIKDIYIGSTTDFTRRKYDHKSNCNTTTKTEYNYKVYQFIRENNGWDNWNMILVENFPCESKLELNKRERYWIETMESKLNCRIPSRTDKEYYNDNRQVIIENKKIFYQDNKDKIKEYQKEYRDKNKELINENNKKYQIKNDNKIKEQAREKVQCECGSIVSKDFLTKHRKRPKHLKLLQQIITP